MIIYKVYADLCEVFTTESEKAAREVFAQWVKNGAVFCRIDKIETIKAN